MAADLGPLLGGIPALGELPEEALDEVAAASVRRSADVGEYLFRQGEGPPTDVFYLISATAEILVGPPDEERTVSLSRPGQLAGWLSVFSSDPFPASARIAEPGELLQLPVEVLRRLLDRHPSVGRVLAATMARRLEDLFEEVRDQRLHAPFSRVETFPFRKRVSEVMSSPALTLPPEATARQAAQAMGEAGVSSLVVVGEAGPLGVVTEKDLTQRVLAEGRPPDATPARDVMSAPVLCVPTDAYLYKALGLMRRRGVRHLAVVDGPRLVGMVSMRALMAMTTSDTLDLVEHIEGAESFSALGDARTQSLAVCAKLLDEGAPAEEVGHLLAHMTRDIHRRALEIALLSLERDGFGSPPVPFCFIVMGSHGRAENHFSTDQDHGMILADYPVQDWDLVEPYFMELGDRVSLGLAEAGFPLCRGHVMSRNPVWRKTAAEWKTQVAGWYGNPTGSAVRYTTLFCDFQPIWGDPSLARGLRDFLTRGIRENHQLLRSLYREASHHKVPLTLFKSFVTERAGPHKGQMDLKRSGILFVVECARILALRYGVTETGTIERLDALAGLGAIPRDEAEFVRTAYRTLFHFLLASQSAQFRGGAELDTYVDPQALQIQERYLLRHALEATGRLQGFVHAAFGDVFF